MNFRDLSVRLFVITFMLVVAQKASANVIFAPTFNYQTYSEDTSSTSSLMADLRLGTTLGTALYVGALYDIQNENNNGAATTTWGLAPSVGVYINSFSLIFSYYVLSERQTPGQKYTNGSGPQIDVGYVFDLGSLKVGPDFTYRQQQWSSPVTKTVSSFRPYLTFFFEF